jgi:hypothetical protein
MNKQLATEKMVTAREFSKLTGYSLRAVQETIKKLYPEKVKNGKTTYLNEYEITIVKQEMEAHHNLAGTCEVKTDLEIMMEIANGYKLAQVV